MTEEIFIIDSNSLIEPYSSFYSFDFAESFWKQLAVHIKSKRIIVLDLVRNEILRGKDRLTDWLNDFDTGLFLNRNQLGIIDFYGKVLDSVKNDLCYKDTALREWSHCDIADAWLIAAAAYFKYTIITFEKHNANLSANTPSKNAKIPDIAAKFQVKTENLYYMMRNLKIKL